MGDPTQEQDGAQYVIGPDGRAIRVGTGTPVISGYVGELDANPVFERAFLFYSVSLTRVTEE